MPTALSALQARIAVQTSYTSTLAAANRTAVRNVDDVQSGVIPLTQLLLTLGTGAAKAQQIFDDTRELGESSSELLMFNGTGAGGVACLNPHGLTITGTKLKALVIINTGVPGTNADIEIGGDATYDVTALFGTNSAAGKLNIPCGGFFIWGVNSADANGVAIATNESLKINNADGAKHALYQIIAFMEGTAA